MNRKNPIISKLNQLYMFLTNPKLVKSCMYATLLIFLPALLIGVIIAYFFGPESYNIWDNYISDLGSLNYTPAPLLLDISAMLTSILFIPIFIYFSTLLFKDYQEYPGFFGKTYRFITKILSLIGLFFLFLASLGFFGIGLFSEDRTTELGLHLQFSVLVFGAFGLASIYNGLVIMLKDTIFHTILGLFMFFSTPAMGILFIANPPTISQPFLEWMILFSIMLWIIPIYFTIYKTFE
ncbi:MAG: hypothetical protein GF311_23905 [Candidatus Lokiarchaeota archaeon]|nr:hypothetical protein [Candidatus Lokiarchaeota archaeon]